MTLALETFDAEVAKADVVVEDRNMIQEYLDDANCQMESKGLDINTDYDNFHLDIEGGQIDSLLETFGLD